ncbi:hypothetical protein BGZ70_006637, partial [Mortierella alpina]
AFRVCAESTWASPYNKSNSSKEGVAEVSGTNDGAAKSGSVDSIGKESGTVDSNSGASYDSNGAQLVSFAGNTSSGSGSGSGSGNASSIKPGIPRIVIPDGTSINLSTPPTTPPTTPRQKRHSIQPSQRTLWPHNLTQIKERLLSPTQYFKKGPNAQNSNSDQDTAQKPEQQYGEHNPTQQNARSPAQEDDNHPIELMGQEPPGEQSTQGQAAERAAAVPLPINTLDHAYLSQFGIMGLSVGYRPESTASSDKFTWGDYNGGSPGRLFSRARWRHLCCSRPGWITMLKHIITTSLGLVMIVAIALTALGKIKNHQQIKLKQAIKIPIWTLPIPPGCLHKECDAENFGKEYFAFMNPESFGISNNYAGTSRRWSRPIRTPLRSTKPGQLDFADDPNQEADKDLADTELTPETGSAQS